MANKLRHIAISVRDPEKTAKFFEEAFGMTRAGNAQRGVYMTDGIFNVALLNFGDEPVAKRLDTKGDGEVNVVLQLAGGTEVEIKLPGRFKVSPQIAGAIKAVPGVLDVHML